MLVPNQLIKVKISTKSYKHYKMMGYDVKVGDTIDVPPEYLQDGTHVNVDVICDICKEKFSKPYCYYLKDHTYNMDCCSKCRGAKTKITWKDKYGVENIAKLDSIKQKTKETCLEKYGVEYPVYDPEIKEKMQKTNIEKYGVSCVLANLQIKEKAIQTTMDHYGTKNPFSSEEVKNKIKQTILQKYGVERITQSPIIQEKIKWSCYKNGVVKTSNQQKQLYEMIQQKYPDAELNYPVNSFFLDVLVNINNVNIDIEYDGWFWHQDKQKDIKRDKFLQSSGLKTLRIRSGHLLPTEQEIFDAIYYLVNTEHHFKEIILSDWKEKEEEECQKQ